MIIRNHIFLSQHATDRLFGRKIDDSDFAMFLKDMKSRLCEVVFELVKDGVVDGRAVRKVYGNSVFAVTFDTLRKKLVVKTVMKR